MRGKMDWFNEEKGHGYIATEEGERIYVSSRLRRRETLRRVAAPGSPVEFERDVERRRRAPRPCECVLVEDAAPPRPVGGTEPAASAPSRPLAS